MFFFITAISFKPLEPYWCNEQQNFHRSSKSHESVKSEYIRFIHKLLDFAQLTYFDIAKAHNVKSTWFNIDRGQFFHPFKYWSFPCVENLWTYGQKTQTISFFHKSYSRTCIVPLTWKMMAFRRSPTHLKITLNGMPSCAIARTSAKQTVWVHLLLCLI